MKNFAVKFKRIFIPFMVINIATICMYTLLNWIFCIKTAMLVVDEEVFNIIAPMVIPWIPVLIWLRPRLKLLNLANKGNKGNPIFGYMMIAWAAIAIPLTIAQSYMVTATGKLTVLDNIRDIKTMPQTKYYTVKDLYVNKRLAHVKSFFKVAGKGNTDYVMDIYAPVPVFTHLFPDTNRIAAMRIAANPKTLIIIDSILSTKDALKKLSADSIRMMRYVNPTLIMPKYGEAGKYGALVVITTKYKMKWKMPVLKIFPAAWLAVKYTETISNRLSVAEKKEAFKKFFFSSYANFRRMDLTKFTYLDRLPYGYDLKKYNIAIRSVNDVEGEDAPVLLPVYTPFSKRNGNKFEWLISTLSMGGAIFLITLLLKPLRNNIERTHRIH